MPNGLLAAGAVIGNGALRSVLEGAVSDAFSFMFGFYGLILGLAVAEIASGFSRAYDERHRRRLGLVAPLFGAVLLIDVITFWMNAFAYRDLAEVKLLTALPVALVALLYYFAATQVFPKASDRDTLDHHIMEHRRVVVFCVVASNLVTQIPNAVSAASTPWPVAEILPWAGLNIFYYVLLGIAALAKSKKVVIADLVLTIIVIVGATALFG